MAVTRTGKVVLGIIGGGVLLAVGVSIHEELETRRFNERMDNMRSAANPTGEPISAPPPRPTPAPASRPKERDKTLDELYAEQTTLQGALDLAIVQMGATENEESVGTLQLTRWAADHLTLADVVVKKNETSFGKVMKDYDAELGKRLCVRGRLISITKVQNSDVFVGLLNTGVLDIFSFFAVQSTGELVEGSRARLCGVVTGRHSYSNTGGGTTHAVKVVGVFDLQENTINALSRLAFEGCACPDVLCKGRTISRLNNLVRSVSIRVPSTRTLRGTSAGSSLERAAACGITRN